MHKLYFSEGHLEPSLSGKKEITIRKYRKKAHNFKEWDWIEGIFSENGMEIKVVLRITADTEVKPFKELTDKEAQEDGYKNTEDAFNDLKKYYLDLKRENKAAIIRYEVLRSMTYSPYEKVKEQISKLKSEK